MQLAHWTLEGMLAASIMDFEAEARLCYKVSLLQPYQRLKAVHWDFIDDVAAIMLGDCDDGDFEAVRELGSKGKAMLRDRGPGYHKETYGDRAVMLGHEVSPGFFGARTARPMSARTR